MDDWDDDDRDDYDRDDTGEPRYLPRSGPMFSRGGTARAEMATDLAIPIVAEGGWPALTLRNVARAANVTPQAIAAWFPSVVAMRVAVAARYGDRWIRQRDYLAHTRTWRAHMGEEPPELSDLVVALLPHSWREGSTAVHAGTVMAGLVRAG